jgi:hypothetical protein
MRKLRKKLLDSNGNEDTTYLNLKDIAKAVLRGKFIAVSVQSEN